MFLCLLLCYWLGDDFMLFLLNGILFEYFLFLDNLLFGFENSLDFGGSFDFNILHLIFLFLLIGVYPTGPERRIHK
jgi:hypothetical protein